MHSLNAYSSASSASGPPRNVQALISRPAIEQVLSQWITSDLRARILVDDDLRVHWMSPAAERLMDEPGALFLRQGYVRASESRFQLELRRVIDGASPQVSTACLNSTKTGEHLVLTAARLAPPHDELIGLTLLRVSDEFIFRLPDLHTAFGLTNTEVRVTHHLLCGRTADETATELRVSLATVRTHIKRAYAKLGVSSREAFFHRLTPLVMALV